MSKTFAIIYGFAEGPWHGQHYFIPAMQRAGFTFEQNPAKADVVVTHSGGCFLVPTGNKQQLAVLIDPTYWPNKSFFTSFIEKVYTDALHCARTGRAGYWFRKTAMNTWYLVRNIRHELAMGKYYPKANFRRALTREAILVIRNKNGAWCDPTIVNYLRPKAKELTFTELPGYHDDCWINPEPYVDLIKSNT